MNIKIKLADRTKPIRSTGFDLGKKSFAGLPKVRQLYYFSMLPSNSLYPLGVCLEPALQEEIEQNINKHTLDARGKDYIHRLWTLGWLR